MCCIIMNCIEINGSLDKKWVNKQSLQFVLLTLSYVILCFLDAFDISYDVNNSDRFAI